MNTETSVTKKSLVSRLMKVIKMNFSNPWLSLTVPLMALLVILGLAFLANLIFQGGSDGQVYFSPEFFLVIMLLVIANQTINQNFSLALSYGISRRDFYLGSLIGFVLLAGFYALVTSLMGLLAQPNFLIGVGDPIFDAFGLVFWALLISQLVGASLTTLYLRWRKVGMSVFFISLGVIVVAAPFVITGLGLWDDLGAMLGADVGHLWGQLGAAAFSLTLAVIGYFLIHRASPDKQ